MIIRRIPQYHFITSVYSAVDNAEFLRDKFLLEFDIPQNPREEKNLFLAKGALWVRLIQRSVDSAVDNIDDLRRENCFYFNQTNEWILESLCTMVNEVTKKEDTFALRLPLSAPFANGRIGLAFDGVHLRYVKNGECLNENSGFERFATPMESLVTDQSFSSARVAAVTDYSVSYREYTEECDVGFYHPYGWNTNVGDVMNFYHDGVYHMLYLFDRRHHRSRNGSGAHYIMQLTTRDLIHWEEQPITVPLHYPWESHGTGTMLFANGKYYLCYGLHSERYAENDNTKMGSAIADPQTGDWNEVTFEDVQKSGRLPTGATYAISDDGIHFTPSKKLFHLGRNPSTYAKDGQVIVYSGYLSNTPMAETNAAYLSRGFGHPFAPTTTPDCFQKNPPLKHTTECPSLFEFGGYRYALLGFTGYYRTLTPNSDRYVDVGAMGESIYDGLCVPMVSSFGKDRRLISGWLSAGAWGSAAMHRELILEENGVLGLKWVPEMIPKTLDENLWGKCDLENGVGLLPEKESVLMTAKITPRDATRLALVFRDAEQKGFEFRMDFAKRRIQIAYAENDGFAKDIPAMHECIPSANKLSDCRDIPRYSNNFCLSNIDCMTEPFTIRILCRYSKRQRATALDVEIAGRRTLASFRRNCFPTSVSVLKSGEASLSDVTLARLSIKHD